MENKFVVTTRFHTEGAEAKLYQRIQDERKKAGLSASEYVKMVLSQYFLGEEKWKEAEQILQEIQKEHRDMTVRVEKTIHRSIQEHDAVLLGALYKMGGVTATAMSSRSEADMAGDASLPEAGEELPVEALDYLASF